MQATNRNGETAALETTKAADMTFYLEDNETGDETFRFLAYITRWPAASGLRLRITEWVSGHDEEGEADFQVVDLLDEVYIPELRMRIPAAEAAAYRPQQTTANDTDGPNGEVEQGGMAS
jgi:hypothetical protein